MKAKLSVEKLLSIVTKGMTAITLPPNVDGMLADYGQITVSKENGTISVNTARSNASSICTDKIEDPGKIASGGGCVVSMPKLRGMLDSLAKGSEVNFVLKRDTNNDKDNLLFRSSKTVWKMPCAPFGIVSKATMDDGDFLFSVPKKDFTHAISSTIFAGNISHSDRINSNLCISINDGSALFGATDEIRCAGYIIKLQNQADDKRIMVPIVMIPGVLRSFDDGDVSVYCGEKFVRISQGDHSVKFALPDESIGKEFPAFEKLIVRKYPSSISVVTEKVKEIFNACFEMNKEECLLIIEDEMSVHAYDSADGMTYHSSLGFTGDCHRLKIGICPIYLVEFLKKVKSDVLYIEFQNEGCKPSHLKIRDDKGHLFILRALVDLLHVPPND